jgi:hypothetical protein
MNQVQFQHGFVVERFLVTSRGNYFTGMSQCLQTLVRALTQEKGPLRGPGLGMTCWES